MGDMEGDDLLPALVEYRQHLLRFTVWQRPAVPPGKMKAEQALRAAQRALRASLAKAPGGGRLVGRVLMEDIAKLQIMVDDLQKHLKAGIENGTFQHGGGRKQKGRGGRYWTPIIKTLGLPGDVFGLFFLFLLTVGFSE